MYDESILDAVWRDCGEADWGPLERFLPIQLCGAFMYMDRVRLEDDTVIHHYKHSDTRHYLKLDDNADAWESLDHGRYRRMRHSDALEQVFSLRWALDHATDEDRQAIRQALDAAWERGNGDRAAGAHILPCSPAAAFRWLPWSRLYTAART
jgi:hypothetical protein